MVFGLADAGMPVVTVRLFETRQVMVIDRREATRSPVKDILKCIVVDGGRGRSGVGGFTMRAKDRIAGAD